MRYKKVCDQSCRSKGVDCSGKEEDIAYFRDQFEAKMSNMKFLRVLKGQCDEIEFEKNLKPNASEEG